MLTEDDKKNILNHHLDNIWGISNKDYQRRIWIHGEGPECGDFDETCNRFFPTIYDILENYKDFKIKENQYLILKKFTEEFAKFSDDNYHPERFIDSPEWTQIMERAKEVLTTFNYQKKA